MRQLLLKNLSLKIVAILFSIVFWIIATHRGLSEMVLDVPLEFKNIPPGLVLVNHDVKKVSLSVKGQERLIRNVRPANIIVYVDLNKAKKGEDIYAINKENLKLPRGVSVTNIEPYSVKVALEKLVSKTVRVKPVIEGDPEKGFYIKLIDVIPQTVVIEGKSSDVKRMSSIRTEHIDITGYKENITQDVKLETPENIKAKVEYVTVKIVIAKRGI